MAITNSYRVHEVETSTGVADTTFIGELLDQVNDLITELDPILYDKHTRQLRKPRVWQTAN
jgi:hypothetical protein